MDILICSKLFFPDNEIGAVRATNFAKYLDEMGHRVTVLTRVNKSIFPDQTLCDSIKIERVNYSNTALKLIFRVGRKVEGRTTKTGKVHVAHQKKETLIYRLYRKLKIFRLQVYNIYLEIDWFFQAKKIINNNTVDFNFDIVLSSFGPLGSHLIGRNVKKTKKANFWIADLRDNMHNEDYSKIINCFYLYFEKEMMRKADAITVVSKGQYNMLQRTVGRRRFKSKNVYIVYNGYEKKVETIQHINNSKVLKIAYTGSLYSGKRDISLLFKALKELIIEGKIETGNIEIHYAGTNSSDLLNQAYFYGMEEIIHDHGYLTRAQSIKLQDSSDILVVLSWNSRKEQGILSGKFFEYFQAFKPIIAITSGDLIGAELTELVEELNLGIACEYLNEKIDIVQLKNYLLFQYNKIIIGKPLGFEPDIEKMKTFHYEKIVEQLEKISMNLVNK